MKLRCSFEMIDMEDEIIAVPVGAGASNVSGIIKLNKSGQEIVELLKEDITEEEIIDTMASRYNDDRDVLSKYVSKVINELIRAELIN